MIESSKVRLDLHFALALAAVISVQPGVEHYSDVLIVRQKTKTVGRVLNSRKLHKYHDNGYPFVYCYSEGALHCRGRKWSDACWQVQIRWSCSRVVECFGVNV